MDTQTIEAYNREAESIARLHAGLTPERIYQLIRQHFIPGGKTLDIGCGIGRDTHWLNRQGYPTLGIDASVEMLSHAKSLYPKESFLQDYLPDLPELGEMQFQNILCSAVLMHLPEAQIPTACKRLLALLQSDGRLIISIRGTTQENQRERGKLYSNIDIKTFEQLFSEARVKVLFQETTTETARALDWHNWVICKHQSV